MANRCPVAHFVAHSLVSQKLSSPEWRAYESLRSTLVREQGSKKRNAAGGAMEFYPVAQQALKRPAAEAGLINQVQQTNGNTIAAPAPSDSCQQSNVVL